MNNFILANHTSINLNFIIYIKNLYENYNRDIETTNLFPWLPIEKSALIDKKVLDIKIKEVWQVVFNTISTFNNMVEQDIKYWESQSTQFRELFSQNAVGKEAFEIVKKSFESWYWGIGNDICNSFSDNLVEDYYNNLKNIVNEKGVSLISKHFYLQVVFNYPDTNWELKNTNMIIISPTNLLPQTEELFELCKE